MAGEIEEMRSYTLTGRLLGNIKFIEKLEKKFKKRLRPHFIKNNMIQGVIWIKLFMRNAV